MKISDVEAISLSLDINEDIDAPISIPHSDELKDVIFKKYRTTLVKITTDEGIVGFGECMVRLSPTATRDIVNELKPVLIGKDPFSYEHIWELLFSTMMNRGHFQGFYIEAISGIDIALWDIMGKALDMPVYKLLGGDPNRKILCYASSLRFRGMDVILNTAEDYIKKGFKAMKIKIGKDPKQDMKVVEEVRKFVGDDIVLMVDANCGYDLKTALKVGKELENYNIYWFEEPITPEDINGYKRLSHSLNIRIAGGETLFTRFGFRDFIKNQCMDIVQPNVSRAGGFTECLKINSLCSTFRIKYAPHTGSSSAICIAASLQLAKAFPNSAIFEHMQSDWSKEQKNPFRWDLTPLPIKSFENNYIELEDKPGIGVEVNEEVIRKYRDE